MRWRARSCWDAGQRTELVADRLPLIRAARRRCTPGWPTDAAPLAEAAAIDSAVSAWKIEGREPPDDARLVVDGYQRCSMPAARSTSTTLVVRACLLLEPDAALGLRWQDRFRHVPVDEFQDVDAAQLRLVRLLAAPQDNLVVIGDDDQPVIQRSHI